MPFALIIAGIVLTVAGVRRTEGALFQLITNDFTGNPSFFWWALSVGAIGAVGYLPGMRQLANAFLALILIVLVLTVNKSGNNVFASFVNAFKNPIPPAPVAGGGSGSSAPSNKSFWSNPFTYDFGPSVDNLLSNIPVIGPVNKAIGNM